MPHQLPWEMGGNSEWLRYWRSSEPHRQTLTDLIRDSAVAGATVCVWGAGSCHDLDLNLLVQAGLHLTLVDINEQNVRWGIEFQLGTMPEQVRVVAPMDLSGVPRDKRPPLDRLADELMRHQLRGLDDYDVVVSAGMLSQVVLDVVEAGGAAGDPSASDPLQARPAVERSATVPALVAALIAARRRHVSLMLDHLKPGGLGLLVIDWVNSSDAPEIATANDLQQAVEAAASANDQTHVLAPASLQFDLTRHNNIARQVVGVEMSNYWLWQMTNRAYACYAMRFNKR